IYNLLFEFSSASDIASAHLTRLTNLLNTSSKGHYDRDTAIRFREAARISIGSHMPAKSLELKHTIRLIRELDFEISEIESEIKFIMNEINSPILSIPGINYRMGAMIIAEIGDFNRFDSPDKILAFAGLSPSTYQSGQLESSHSHMEKRGSRYLRYALFNATKFVCHWDPTFAAYLEKKRSEGKHYNIAVSHAAKKLVRVIYQLQKSGQSYIKAA
ncbi:MAG TPA: IS110 family transposase, partial [Eubacteriaceae bacterium]|nr:IS110 family transposase [Eubacteriaceae bacterium]